MLLPILLAGVLAAEITGLAIARSIVPASPVEGATAPMSPSVASIGRLHDDIDRIGSTAALRNAPDPGRDPLSALAAVAHSRSAPVAGPGVTPASPVQSAGGSATRTVTRSAPAAYHGRNHVWIPALRINRSVSSFSCSRSRPPDNYVYRWGCAGRNNVYLLGHAYSVFKPLHDAYVSGRLGKGLKVIYADGAGHVHTYSVIWWRVVRPTTSASWAWASLARPSMTLQTCLGAHSEYRLMVRLARVG
jgi:sortase family protein